jgi:hypothetical protein
VTSASIAQVPYTLSVATNTVYSVNTGNVTTLNESDLAILGNPYLATPGSNYLISFADSIWVNGATNNKVYRVTLVNQPLLSPASQTPTTVVVGSPFTSQAFTATNFTPTSYSVSPALPAGLTLNTSTGQISGTPSAVSPTTTYTITGAAGSTTSTATITFGVSAALAQTGVDDKAALTQGILALSSLAIGFAALAYSRGLKLKQI